MVRLTSRRRAPASPRYLAHRHARKLLSKRNGPTFAPPDPTRPPLLPGEQRLFSYNLPSLAAGPHTISSTQTVTAGTQSLTLSGTQTFSVAAPRYTLPDGSVYSVYPPPGHADAVEVLPHVVLNDPFMPWERHMSVRGVPWVAVLVFSQDEIRVDQSIFGDTTLQKPVVQNTALGVEMTLRDLKDTKCMTPVLNERREPRDGDDPETLAEFVFVPAALFNSLVAEEEGGQTTASVARYQWLAHVRDINTTGMANAGMAEDEEGSFSVVVSHRVGPIDITAPTTACVHLVSIEHVDGMQWPVSNDQVVALTSLASWTYNVLPPDSLNVPDAFRNLGNTVSVLRAEENLINSVMDERLKQRMRDGYTITRYRTQTGEETVALLRGALTPTVATSGLEMMSNFGTDLQVLDRELGIMDITYSVAWQLGKTMALADQSFTTALGKIRTEITGAGIKAVKAAALRAIGSYNSLSDTLTALTPCVSTLRKLPAARLARGPMTRWRYYDAAPHTPVSNNNTLNFSFDGPLQRTHFAAHAAPHASALAASTTPGELYNEHNTPANSDWSVVLAWVLDRLYLSGIPAHHLISDPSHLPPESLRTFLIDAAWTDALIDGALSVANHLESDDDKVRALIKQRINEYLAQPLAGLDYAPQIPTAGFLLRSEVCTKFPDLIVEAPFTATLTGAEILRQENLDENVLLALFDRVPGSTALPRLVFRQPPHLQSFSVGTKLGAARLDTAYKRVYTLPLAEQPTGPERQLPIKTRSQAPADADRTFEWTTRTLRLPQWVDDVHATIQAGLGVSDFSEPEPTPVLAAIQLNSPMYFLEILDAARPPPATHSHHVLKMLQPRTKNAHAPFALDRLVRTPDTWRNSDYSTPLRRKPIPHPHPRPPPHYRALPTLPPDTPPRRGKDAPPAGAPQFSYGIFSLGHASTVPMQAAPQDLILSIRLLSPTPNAYQLQQLTISLRLGAVSAERKNLAMNYAGPGATMLSNLRFNALVGFREEEGDRRLEVRLVPRSTKGWVILGPTVQELGVVLAGVRVNRYDLVDGWTAGGEVRVYTEVVERYVGFEKVIVDPVIIKLVEAT